MRLYYRISLILFFCLMFCRSAFAQPFDQIAGFWAASKVYGRFYSEKLNYQGELHVRINSEGDVFDQGIVRFGLGYGVSSSARVWLGYDFRPTYEVFVRKLEYEQRVWQQLSLHIIKRPGFVLDSRTRLEMRDDLDEDGIAWRVRQMFTVLFPKKMRGKITPFISDEIFINFNHPDWVSEKTLSQNRLYIGVLVPCKHYATVRISYVNQIIVGRGIKQMRHNIFVSLILRHDLI